MFNFLHLDFREKLHIGEVCPKFMKGKMLLEILEMLKLREVKKVIFYKATKDGKIKYFKSPTSAKPDGYYFTIDKENALKWGRLLYGTSFYIHKVEVEGNIKAIGSKDGFYSEPGMAKMNNYFVDRLDKIVKKLKENHKKLYWNGELDIDDRALPEVIIQNDNFKEIEKKNLS